MAKSGPQGQELDATRTDRSGDERPLLHPLLSNPSHMKREAVKRRQVYETMPVGKDHVAEHEAEGWEVDRELKTKVRLRRGRSIDERVENRFWYLLHRLGYPEMSCGRHFTIQIDRQGAEPLRKQIDVFAKDDETVIVAECKASQQIRKRSLQQDIEEFANLKGPISNAIRKHYGDCFKPKIIWLFVTENIIWSAPDKERAAGESIRIITERELRYYQQIADHLGSAARYQFLAEFLKNQRIPHLQDVIVPAIRGKLGGRKFYAFVTTPRQLLKISFVNHRSLNDPEGAPSYQRLVSRTRMTQIGRFLERGGFFPTNLLINFTCPVRFDTVQKNGLTDVTFGQLYLPDRYQSAWIIDGQHRLYGYAHLSQKHQDQNVVVVAFEKLSKEEEANLFVTINHEQKTVPKNLLDDLEGELKWGSAVPTERIGAISARLIGYLNDDVGEPFYARVTRQGIPATDRTCLTVPSFKDGLRRSGLLGRAIMEYKVYEPGALCGPTDGRSLDRARSTLNHFFSLIRDSNLSQWEKGRAGYLCTNVAIQAYLMLLKTLIEYMEANRGMAARELEPESLIMELDDYMQPLLKFLVDASDHDMEQTFTVPFGSGGPREYYFRLCHILKNELTDFTPEGMVDWEAEQSEEKVNNANKQLTDLFIKVQSHIFRVFRRTYGAEGNAYWERGVVDNQMKIKAYQTSLDSPVEERLPLEHYLNFIDYKKIVEKQAHWPLFQPVFDIPSPGEKGHAKNLQWMDRVNELRRIAAHPTEMRHYKVEDFEYIEWIHSEVMTRMAAIAGTESESADASA